MWVNQKKGGLGGFENKLGMTLLLWRNISISMETRAMPQFLASVFAPCKTHFILKWCFTLNKNTKKIYELKGLFSNIPNWKFWQIQN